MENLLLKAKQGDPDAQFALGRCYWKGFGVPEDYGQAAYWYRKAAEQDNDHAMYYLAQMYCHGGSVVPQDYEQAVYWFRQAAEKGNSYAQFYLGSCYDNGKGVPKDKQEAIYWYYKSAGQGNFCAQAALDRLQGKWYRLIKELSE